MMNDLIKTYINNGCDPVVTATTIKGQRVTRVRHRVYATVSLVAMFQFADSPVLFLRVMWTNNANGAEWSPLSGL